MSASAAVLTRSWSVGRFTVTLTCPRPEAGASQVAAIEWAPHAPDRLTAAELRQYREGRDAAVAELAGALRLRIAVVEATP